MRSILPGYKGRKRRGAAIRLAPIQVGNPAPRPATGLAVLGAQFHAFLAGEITRWKQVIETGKITAE